MPKLISILLFFFAKSIFRLKTGKGILVISFIPCTTEKKLMFNNGLSIEFSCDNNMSSIYYLWKYISHRGKSYTKHHGPVKNYETA
jgi:hypothetical protein